MRSIFILSIIIVAISLVVIFFFFVLTENQSKIVYLDDGTIVNGDVHRINITSYQMIAEKKLYWDNTWENYSYKISRSAIVPYKLDITDIFSNFSKRKDIALTYLDKNIPLASHPVDWNDNYTGYYHPIGGNILIQNFSIDSKLHSWRVSGQINNIYNNNIDLVFIFIHFYNNNSVLLSTRNAVIGDLQIGESKDFSVRYDGSLKNDVYYISFEVITDPFEKMGPINQLIP